MPDSTPSSSSSESALTIAPRHALISLGVVALLASLLYLPALGARDLWNPNEPLYAEVVAEMQADDLWLTPTFHGETFPEKPPLYFWMARIASSAVGELNELSLRLPAAFSALALVCICYLWVLPLAGRRRAIWSAALLSTTFVVFWSARQIQMDLLLTCCIWLCILGVSRVIDGLGRPAVGWSLCGIGAGLAVLAKGPAGVICPALIVLIYLTLERKLSSLRSPWLLLALGWGVLISLPWFLGLLLAGEREFVFEVLWRQNVSRAIDPWDHRQPWWYYAKYFWIDMAPWVWWLPLAWRPASGEAERRLHRFCWCTIVLVLLFFSLSASKRSPYIMPLAPAVAVLVASVLDRGRELGSRRVVSELAAGALALVLAVIGGGLLVGRPWTDGPQMEVERAATIVGVALLVVAALALAFQSVPRLRAYRSQALILFVGLVYLLTAVVALPAADHFKSHRPLADLIRREVPESAPLRGFHEWDYRSNYSFYAGRAIVNLDDVDALETFWRREETVYVVVERGRLELARQVLGSTVPMAQRSAGRNLSYLFCNRPRSVEVN